MLFLGGNEHSVKVSSNSEMVRAGVLFENFGDYRESILKPKVFVRFHKHCIELTKDNLDVFSDPLSEKARTISV